MNYKFKHAILGGTFDHLHAGHKHLITSAFKSARRVTIGLVLNPTPHDKSYFDAIESYGDRLANLQSFLSDSGFIDKSIIIELTDIYGTSLTDSEIDAIFVTEHTHANALLINKKRSEANREELDIITIPYLMAEDGLIISSSRIRAGLISQAGVSYLSKFKSHAKYTINDSLRDLLKEPFGEVITNMQQLNSVIRASSLIFTVGDVVSSTLLDVHTTPSIAIYDHSTQRKQIDEAANLFLAVTPNYHIANKAGSINNGYADLFIAAISDYQKNHQTVFIKVDGEEDLLTLPTILLAPLNSYVIYGIPSRGICIVEVTPKTKDSMYTLLRSFN